MIGDTPAAMVGNYFGSQRSGSKQISELPRNPNSNRGPRLMLARSELES